MPESNSTWDRLEHQIAWYNRRSDYCQRMFKWLKGIEVFAAAVIPLGAGFGLLPFIMGLLGVLIVVLEGIQHVNQYHHNWMTYRSTCEALKHEKFLYLGKASLYATASDPHVLLTERIESLISEAHSKWIAGREQAAKPKGTIGSGTTLG